MFTSQRFMLAEHVWTGAESQLIQRVTKWIRQWWEDRVKEDINILTVTNGEEHRTKHEETSWKRKWVQITSKPSLRKKTKVLLLFSDKSGRWKIRDKNTKHRTRSDVRQVRRDYGHS